MGERIRVQVCYATPALEFLRELEMEQGATIEQALAASGLTEALPGIDLPAYAVGIFAKKRALDTVLRDQDRVEVYRPLLADPKETRRKRAAKKKSA
jgi:hypothetical protein